MPSKLTINFFSIAAVLTLIVPIAYTTVKGVSDDQSPKRFTTVSYSPSDEDFPNPERGAVVLVQPQGSQDGLPAEDLTLVSPDVRANIESEVSAKSARVIRIVYVIGRWRDTSLPPTLLSRIANDFSVVRELGLKVIPYFAYSWPLDENKGFDASASWIRKHLKQLQPLLMKNEDITAFVYAGFIGPWGEWHSSTSGNLSPPNDDPNNNTISILNALMAAVPRERMVVLRYLQHKKRLFGASPLTTQEAFSSSTKARLGFHDECYMSDYHPDVRRNRLNDQAYLNIEGRYVPQAELMDSGCFNFPQALWRFVPCRNLLEQVSRTHPDVIHLLPPVHVEPECAREISRKVGYRYQLLQVNVSRSVTADSKLLLNLSIFNSGFGALYNRRPLDVVLRSSRSGELYRFRVSNDVRILFPSPGQKRKISLTIPLSQRLPPSDYEILLHLPDNALRLANRSNYSIRFANTNIWEPQSGMNSLGIRVHILSSTLSNSGKLAEWLKKYPGVQLFW
jgi:hypothetical protein